MHVLRLESREPNRESRLPVLTCGTMLALLAAAETAWADADRFWMAVVLWAMAGGVIVAIILVAQVPAYAVSLPLPLWRALLTSLLANLLSGPAMVATLIGVRALTGGWPQLPSMSVCLILSAAVAQLVGLPTVLVANWGFPDRRRLLRTAALIHATAYVAGALAVPPLAQVIQAVLG
jgi:hypothetical protein